MIDERDMKLTYRVIDEYGSYSDVQEMIIGNLYSFPEINRKRKAQGCAARANCCSIYSVDVINLDDVIAT